MSTVQETLDGQEIVEKLNEQTNGIALFVGAVVEGFEPANSGLEISSVAEHFPGNLEHRAPDSGPSTVKSVRIGENHGNP